MDSTMAATRRPDVGRAIDGVSLARSEEGSDGPPGPRRFVEALDGEWQVGTAVVKGHDEQSFVLLVEQGHLLAVRAVEPP
jgi:hypothetical protein